MSFMNAKAYKRNPDILKEFDFIETFNACESLEVNERAARLAEKYNLTGTGGSDAHRLTAWEKHTQRCRTPLPVNRI